jgi:hypothetical protein
VSDTVDQQKRVVAGGIWLVIGDIVVLWYGLAFVYFVGGLMLVGIFMACEWVLGPEAGWRVGFWVVILGGTILAIMGHVAWRKHELWRREAEYRRYREEQQKIVRG